MATFDKVPVVDVHKDNFMELWPSLLLSIKSATYVAIDLELSGLGNRKLLNARDLDDRYQQMCEVARTRSIVSFGLSCFKLMPESVLPATTQNHHDHGDISEVIKAKSGTSAKLHFHIQTYDIIVLCSEEYVVEPASVKFLVEHGFDFNRQYAEGIPYCRGNDKIEEEGTQQSLRQLFTELLLTKCPIILHNALVDLVFLYQSFYGNLPQSQQAFLTDLADMFVGGVFDSKYITDYKARMSASYLEYVFRKCQRENVVGSRQGWSHTTASFVDYGDQLTDSVVYQPCGLPELGVQGEHLTVDDICLQYANHGWCPGGNGCQKTHDIDIILDIQDHSSSKRHKKRRKDKKSPPKQSETEECGSPNPSNDQTETTSTEESASPKHPNKTETTDVNHKEPSPENSHSTEMSPNVNSKSLSNCSSHRAGFDAFMTGLIFGFYSARYGKPDASDSASDIKMRQLGMDEFRNKVYLVGKDIPLQIAKSSFSKPSKNSRAKLKKIGLIT